MSQINNTRKLIFSSYYILSELQICQIIFITRLEHFYYKIRTRIFYYSSYV